MINVPFEDIEISQNAESVYERKNLEIICKGFEYSLCVFLNPFMCYVLSIQEAHLSVIF